MANKLKFNTNDQEFTIRKYGKRDEQVLIPLMNKNFDENWTLNDWNWKYKQNPSGFSILILLNEKGRILGQFGHLFKKWYYYGKECNSLMGVDVFIDKSLQGFGLTGKLFKYLHDFHPEKGFFHYGFPNDAALKAYSKSGDIYNNYSILKMNYLSKKYNIFFKLLLNSKSKNIFDISEASKENKGKIDDLWNKKKKELDVCVVRDWDYLNWRILTCPDKMKLFMIKNGGETVGYFSTMIKDRVCYITDILILNDFTNKNTIKQIEVFCLKHNIKEIRIFITDESIKSLFKYFKFNFYEIGQFTYFNNIEKDTRILPYFTFTDFDSV